MEDKYFNVPIDFLNESDIKVACRLAINYAVKIEYDNNYSSIARALENLGITNNDHGFLEKNINKLQIEENSPKVGIKKSMLFQFRDEEKTDFEVWVFRAFCGLKSIIGSKPLVKSIDDYLEARMWGFSTVEEFQYSNSKVLSRYTKDKIKIELQLNWGLVYYSRRTRGFYFSFTASLEKIIKYAEEKRMVYQKRELLRNQNEVYEKVIFHLKKPN